MADTDLRALVQKTLDSVLLPDGILSHHLRHVRTGTVSGLGVKVNPDEYAVYRIVSSRGGGYGDGKAHLCRYFIDVNYYCAYEKTDSRFAGAEKRIRAIIDAFLSDKRFHLANGQSDIYDIDNPYRGIHVEFLFVEVIGHGQ